MEDERLHATVRGSVQGVGFRYFVLTAARSLGLAGSVANRHDRNVEVIAEGPRVNLLELLRLLHEGPRSSVVKGVDAEWNEATGEFDGFDVTF